MRAGPGEVTYQAGEGVVHAVLQRAPLQDGEEGGVVEAGRRRRDQLLHLLALPQVQTCGHTSWVTSSPSRREEEAIKRASGLFLITTAALTAARLAEPVAQTGNHERLQVASVGAGISAAANGSHLAWLARVCVVLS